MRDKIANFLYRLANVISRDMPLAQLHIGDPFWFCGKGYIFSSISVEENGCGGSITIKGEDATFYLTGCTVKGSTMQP